MHDFERKLITEWRRLGLPQSGRVVIAVSGGADSVSLLYGLDRLVKGAKLAIEITVAHFNHRLRGDESDADENFVRGLCARLDLPLAVGQMKTASRGNLEQDAREARYDFLQSVAENVNAFAVATAHTLNDQAETFLQNLIRGSGMTGLGAMSPSRKFHLEDKDGDLLLIRPLLEWSLREETVGYCSSNNIDFRYDSMNEDLRFNRVRIRKVILPMLREMNPQIVQALSRTADMIRSKSESEDGIPYQISDRLKVSELKNMELSELKTLIRKWLGLVRGSLRGVTSAHVIAIVNLIMSTKSGRVVELPGKSRVVKSRGSLVFETE